MTAAQDRQAGLIRVGIGGWVYAPWRGAFYPKGLTQSRELEFASRALTSIEVNGTFYRTQKPETFAKWHDETPEGFVFALKGPRFATNRRELAGAGESIERFLTSGIAELKDKLGPINWQFAATKRFDAEDVAAFLDLLPNSLPSALPGAPEGRPLRHAVEVRHESFRCAEFIALARERGVAVVTAGDSEYPQIADATAPFVYARIMGTVEEEPAGYSGAALAAWAQRMKRWAGGGTPADLQTASPKPDAAAAPQARDVFLYVISGFKARNPAAAQALLDRLG